MLNFDWTKIMWFFVWADVYYNHFGTPTCPREAHEHPKVKDRQTILCTDYRAYPQRVNWNKEPDWENNYSDA